MNNNIIHAQLFEKQRIIDFLNENWGSVHQLVNNDIFFNYYYVDGEYINFYYIEELNEIVAICGYIKASKDTNCDIWISIWCAKKGKNGVGLALMGAMAELVGCEVISCNNIRKNTMPFYLFLGYHPDKLNHYYRLNNLDSYNIPLVANKFIPSSKKASNVALKIFNTVESIDNQFEFPVAISPKKDIWYVENRYYKNPYYKYNVYGIYLNDKCVSLVVFRVNASSEGNVLRLVDYIGEKESFILLSGFIDELMNEYSCEYCDCYCFGVDATKAGLTLRSDVDKNIIPNYLNPLLKENTDYYFFTSNLDNFVMFKADGDQDRGNI